MMPLFDEGTDLLIKSRDAQVASRDLLLASRTKEAFNEYKQAERYALAAREKFRRARELAPTRETRDEIKKVQGQIDDLLIDIRMNLLRISGYTLQQERGNDDTSME